MTDQERWHTGNDQYLALALAWLRLRLELLAQRGGPPDPEPESAPAPGWRPWRRASGRHGTAVADDAAGRAGELGPAADRMERAEAELKPPPALRLVADRLGLSPFERQVLLLCVAMELDTRIADLCARAHGRPHPTFALALALFDNPAWDVISPERPLRYWRLVEISQGGAQPLTTSPLRADERIVNAVKGLNYLDDRLSPLMMPLGASSLALAPSQDSVAAAAIAHLRRQAESVHRWPLLQLVGRDGPGMRQVAGRIASALDLPVYRLPVGLIPGATAELETAARLWQRECLLAPVALYLDAHEVDEKSPQQPSLVRFLARTDGLILLGTREVWPDLGRSAFVLDVVKPTFPEQKHAWAEAVGDVGDPGRLAAQFDLGLEAIDGIASEALETDEPPPLQDRLWDGCRRAVRPRMETLAQRIDPKVGWDHLVLPEAETRLLRQLADQVRARSRVYGDWGFAQVLNRGLGISALFAGESGTGKTMAAEVIARDLRLDLYRIDLASVVSKYIGETEKNLRRLFDAAEDGGAILFFDEADALFGKRSEVKDAHDRYANIEINYLLQRMEAYRGLAILATNVKSAMDPAFTRRLRFIVRFPFPGVADRRRIWTQAFPASTPVRGLDYDRLARLNLTGAGIHNAALNAAFLAARGQGEVTMREVLDAARAEFKKLERPINESDFRLQEVGA